MYVNISYKHVLQSGVRIISNKCEKYILLGFNVTEEKLCTLICIFVIFYVTNSLSGYYSGICCIKKKCTILKVWSVINFVFKK